MTIDPDGKTIPVMWNSELVPEVYAPAIGKLSSVVAGAAIENVFLSDRQTWGTPVTGIWEHLAIVPGSHFVFESTTIYSIYQIVAQKQQDYQMLLRGLADFPLAVAQQAYSLLSNATLYRSEACLGIAKWFLDLQPILPTAKTIEYFVPASQQSYMALVTAKNPEAPPIIQWDTAEYRNPVTWYFYVNGSLPSAWNLRSNTYCAVTAIVLQPSLWNHSEKFAHKGEKAFLILQNANDKEYVRGAGFFPESLKSEYHGIRSTMEAYAKNAVLEGKDDATACGIGLQKGGSWDLILLRITTGDNLQVKYQLDRWD